MGQSTEEIERPSKDLPVLISGILAWVLLVFGAVKLSVIYAANTTLAYFLTYNIAALICQLYFFGYLRDRYRFGTMLLLFLGFNIGIHLTDILYDLLFTLHPKSIQLNYYLVISAVNFALMIPLFFVVKKLFKSMVR